MNTLKNLLSQNDDERLLAEVRTYQEKLISNAEEPIWERKWLTIEEAAAYSGIGRTKLRELSNQAGCPFAIWIGNKIHIVRERLDKYIDKQFRIQEDTMATKRKDKSRVVLKTREVQRKDGTYQFSWQDSQMKRRFVYARTLDDLRKKAYSER